MKITLIILTYNWPEALEKVLQSVSFQTYLPFEVIIADDGSGEKTRQIIEITKEKFPVPLLHVWHPDDGFRIAKIRNEAVRISSGDYFIFSDGDLVLHPQFIADFRKNLKIGEAQIGSRVFLTKEGSDRLLTTTNSFKKLSLFSPLILKNRINAMRIPFSGIFFSAKKYNVKLRGGLLGVWKSDLMKVNGWNEDFEGWGLEDSELLSRLSNSGVIFRKLKFRAITYHLWHKTEKREHLSTNRSLLEKSILEKKISCSNGIEKLNF